MKNYDVYGIGNALVDSEYEVDDAFIIDAKMEKGIMTLIEADERRSLLQLLEEKHEHVVVKLAGGGSAANTIFIVAQLGGAAFYSCKVASDETGDFFMKDLNAAGVDTNLDSGREKGITGECISMVTPDAERTMMTHLGITQSLSTKELNTDALRQSRFLYIEGYLVSSPTAYEAALKAQQIAHEAGVKVTLTLSDPAMVQNFKDQFDKILDAGVDILFCNEDEAKLLANNDDRDAAIEHVRKICKSFVVTCGKEGAIVCAGDQLLSVPGVPTQPVDTTGAGDIFAGSFLFALSRGASFSQAAELANKAASLLVSSFGARLDADAVAKNLANVLAHQS